MSGHFCTKTLPLHNEVLQMNSGTGFAHREPTGGQPSAPTSDHHYRYVIQRQGLTTTFRSRLVARGTASLSVVISITTKSPYALQALAELGRCGGAGPVPIGELARRRDIPVQFLEQLFAVLRRAGLLRSQRGVKGGYAFARDPSDITVLEVVELLDGPFGRGATGIFAEAAEAGRKVMAGTTIADVVEREAREAGEAMYYI